MKMILLLLILLSTLTALGQPVSLSKSDRKKVENFLTQFLGLSFDERELFNELEIHVDKNLDDRLSGFTREGSNVIDLRSFHHLSTIVHEMIHQFSYETKSDDSLLNQEGLALLGEFLFLKQVYGRERAIISFLPLVEAAVFPEKMTLDDFSITSADYGKSFLFYLFLYENFYGNNFVNSLYHSSKSGLAGISFALQTSLTFRLTPKEWKTVSFLASTFFWSLTNRKNMLATSANDSFSQLLGVLRKAEPKELSDFEISLNAYSFVSFKFDACKSSVVFENTDKVSGYQVTRSENGNLSKIFLKDNSVDSVNGSFYELINSTDRPVNLKVRCL